MRKLGLIALGCSLSLASYSQKIISETPSTVTMAASDRYYKSKFYRSLFGEHYRQLWHTPVTFNKVNLDTLEGGLTAYEAGGGRQSKSIRLRDKQGREYVLRSIDKSFSGALPPVARGTFVEDIADDQVTISNPFSAVVIAPLAEAAGIYHTNPRIFFVPKQPALGRFNDSMGNTLYLFEQRPDEDWATAANFANSKKIISTDNLREKMLEDNDNSVDQKMFLRSRLFDMWINDWGRHEDQWRWAKTEKNGLNIYEPIPRDRDNAFTRFDGLIVKTLGPDYFQTFGPELKDVTGFNYTARNLDRRFTNELTLKDWLAIANDLSARLTDKSIDDAVAQLPKEIYPLAAEELKTNLKSRRQFLPLYAQEYFEFINKKGIDIPGTAKAETFVVDYLGDKQFAVSIFDQDKQGVSKSEPYFTRLFNTDETNEIRLYSINGDDKFEFKGQSARKPKVYVVTKNGNEQFDNASGNKVRVVMAERRKVDTKAASQIRFMSDPGMREYKYANYTYDKSSFKPIAFYSNEDRFHAGLAYVTEKHKWNKTPFAQRHAAFVKYSIDQKAFSGGYSGTFVKVVGPFNLNLFGNYDAIRWTNYFGIGNENQKGPDNTFNRYRSRELLIEPSLEQTFRNKHRLKIAPFYATTDVLTDTDRLLFKQFGAANEVFNKRAFTGGLIEYVFQSVNDSMLPTKGIAFRTTDSYEKNLDRKNADITRLTGEVHFYVPLFANLGIHSSATGQKILGDNPEIYQFARLGGTNSLRGFQRHRFYGHSAFSSQNELRWVKNVHSYIYSGKIGVFALYDIGRVWQDGENSKTWHSGYGGGILLSPFNRITVTASYAKSKDDSNIHLGLITPL